MNRMHVSLLSSDGGDGPLVDYLMGVYGSVEEGSGVWVSLLKSALDAGEFGSERDWMDKLVQVALGEGVDFVYVG